MATARAATRAALAEATPLARGGRPRSPRCPPRRGGSTRCAAAAGVDVALHDLVGRATGRPVAALLGGARRAVVEASALIDAGPPEVCAYAAARALARGFRCIKMKIDRDLGRSVARLEAARTAAPELDIRADANGCFDTAGAIAAARRLRDLPLDWLEQPVPAGDIAALRRGTPRQRRPRRRGRERHRPRQRGDARGRCRRRRRQGRADGRTGTPGSPPRALRPRAGLGAVVTTAIDTGIGTAAALHLALALDDPPPCGVATAGLLAGDLIVQHIGDGPKMAPPPGPGLGITIDAAALARWRVAEAA